MLGRLLENIFPLHVFYLLFSNFQL